MRKLLILVAALFAMSVAVPVLGEMTKEQKNECLVQSKGCMHEVDTIKQKIKKLDAEIKKGKKVYSPEELKALNAKLKEAEDMVDNLLKP